MKFIQMRKSSVYILLILVTLLLAGCSSGGSAGSALKNITDSGNILTTDGDSHDWGPINIKGGKVKRTFTLKNESAEELILKGASTSCMCTNARYRLSDDSLSPQYGLHNNPTFWSKKVKPQETFDVEVVFDPMAHGPDAVGVIRRSVFLESSAKNNPKLELVVSGEVLYEKDYEEKMKEKRNNMPL